MLRFGYILQGSIGLFLGSALQTQAFRCDGWTTPEAWTLNVVSGALYLIGGTILGRAYEQEKGRPSN